MSKKLGKLVSRVFRTIDKDNGGTISTDEVLSSPPVDLLAPLLTGIVSSGPPLGVAQVKDFFKQSGLASRVQVGAMLADLDKDGNGEIDEEEWLDFWISHVRRRISLAHMSPTPSASTLPTSRVPPPSRRRSLTENPKPK